MTSAAVAAAAVPMPPSPGRLRARLRGVVDVLASLIPGLLVYVALYRELLDPRNVSWLFSPNPLTFDVATSSLAWLYFKADDSWRWPLGSNPDYGGDVANSLLFTDSVPAFTVPLKIVFGVLGIDGPTQMLGLALLTCLLLQSALSAALVRRWGGSQPLALLGAALFCLTPALLVRWNITSLFWQWMVLAGLLLASTTLRSWSRVAAWCGLVLISTGITPYITIMILTMACGDLAVRALRGGLVRLVVQVVALGASSMFGLYAWGAFSIDAGASVTGDFGEYSASGLALLDSGGSTRFLPDLPGGTGEGYAYLGAGVLLLVLVGAVAGRRHWLRPSRPTSVRDSAAARPVAAGVVLTTVLLALLSLMPVLVFGPVELRIPMPDTVISALSAFRANGRFLWPLMYAVMAGAVVLVGSQVRRAGVVVVATALAVQVVDLSPLLRTVDKQVVAAVATTPRFQPELRTVLGAPGVRGVDVVPAFPFPRSVPYREIGLAAQSQGLRLDSLGYFNRYDVGVVEDSIAEGLARIAARALEQDVVYVVGRDVYEMSLLGWRGATLELQVDDWALVRAVAPGRTAPPLPALVGAPTIAPDKGFAPLETDASGASGAWLVAEEGQLVVTGSPNSVVSASLSLVAPPCGPVSVDLDGAQVEGAGATSRTLSVRLGPDGRGDIPLTSRGEPCSPAGDFRPLRVLVYGATASAD